MNKFLSLTILIVSIAALPFHAVAQQATPPTPAAGKRSTPAAGKASPSTSAPSNLAMPVPAEPRKAITPIPVKRSASESEPTSTTSKPHATNWEVYPADQMPPGKSLTEPEAAKLESGDYSEKVRYLVGTFYVAVSEKNRAILWPSQTLGPVHIVVAYPLSIPAPEEGARIVREAPRGYRITRIKHTASNETTIYVRDITVP